MKQSKDCNIKSWQMRNPDKFVKWFHIYLYYIKRSLVATWKINYCIVFLNFICLHYNTTVKAGRTDSGAHWEIQLNSALLIHTIYTYIYVGGKGFQGSTGSGKYKVSTHAPLPHSSQVIPRLRRDHDNNTTKLKKYVVKHFFEFYSHLTQLLLFQIYTDWKCNPRWIFKKCDPILANKTAQ